MKKIKLLTTGLIATIATVTPLMVVTSCNKNTNKDIEIKTNPNIKIECPEAVVGQDLTITYKLDDGYSFNLKESTIEFAESNLKIYLWQCEVNIVNKTITVPGELVISKKVTIDIKAENTASYKVSQAEYTAAIALIENMSTSRKFTADGVDLNFYIDEEYEISKYDESDLTWIVNGLKERQIHQSTIEGKPYVLNYWTAPDDKVGYWNYSQTPEETKPTRVPSTQTQCYEYFKMIFDDYIGRDITKLDYNPIFNAYYIKSESPISSTTVYIKFADKKISDWGMYDTKWDESTKETLVRSLSFGFSYSAEEINIPTDYKDPTDKKLIHDETDKYVAGTKSLTYTYTSTDDCLGRYVIPMNNCTTWTTDPIKISITAEKRDMDYLRVAIWNNDKVLTKGTDYTVDGTTGDITITATIDTSKDLIVILDTPTFTTHPTISSYTKMTISQE